MIRRIVGCGLVVATVVITYALAGVAVTPPSSSATHPLGFGGEQVIFAVRNNNPTQATISAASDPSCGFTVLNAATGQPMGGSGQGVVVGPNDVVQVQVITSNLSDMEETDCAITLTVNNQGSGVPQETAKFIVNSGSATIDLEPITIDFGSHQTGDAETQKVSFYNYTASTLSAPSAIISGDSTGSLTVSGGCTTTTMPMVTGNPVGVISKCGLGDVTSQGSGLVSVTCNPTPGTTGHIAGTLTIGSNDPFGGQSIPLSCDAVPTSGITVGDVTLSGTVNTTLQGTAPVTATGPQVTLAGAMISGGDAAQFTFFGDANCSSQTCVWMPGIEVTPAMLGIQCTPTSQTLFTSTLTVHGVNAADVAQSTVTCTGTAAGAPILVVTPKPFPSFPTGQFVGQAVTQNMTVGDALNAGAPIAGVAASAGAFAGDYSIGGCTPASPCNFPVGGGSSVAITFTPSFYGDRTTTITVNSMDGEQIPVTVGASGSGARLLNPNNVTSVDLGNVPKNFQKTRNVQIQDDGNISIAPTVTVTQQTPASGPINVGSNVVPLLAGGTDNAVITCGSNAPTADATGTVEIKAAGQQGVFDTSDFNINVHCKVVDTALAFDKDADFGVVLSSAAPTSQIVNIINTGTAAGMFTSVALSQTSPHVTLKQPLPAARMVAPGDMIPIEVDLTPAGSDEDFGAEGLQVVAQVDSTQITTAVLQQIVHTDSGVAPNPLDLGSVCVGVPADGSVTLTNTGTASLTVMSPTVDTPFTTPDYAGPTTLQPNDTAMASAHLDAQANPGTVTSMLHWTDSAHEHDVPVTVTYLGAGIALSPTMLDFGIVMVGQATNAQTTAINNCDTSEHDITIHSLQVTTGAADAWHLSPAPDDTTPHMLAGRSKLAVQIYFAPLHGGHYQATLPIENDDGTTTNIQLSADVPGALDDTSFYACGCSGPEGPAAGWPIGIAVIVLLRRRPKR